MAEFSCQILRCCPNFIWFIGLFYVIKCIYLDIYPKLSPCYSAQYISFTVLRPKLFVQFNLGKQCQLLIRQLFPAHLREKVRTTFGKWYGFPTIGFYLLPADQFAAEICLSSARGRTAGDLQPGAPGLPFPLPPLHRVIFVKYAEKKFFSFAGFPPLQAKK